MFKAMSPCKALGCFTRYKQFYHSWADTTETHSSSHSDSPHHSLSCTSWDSWQRFYPVNTLEKHLNISKRCGHSSAGLQKGIYAIFLGLAQGYLELKIHISTLVWSPMLRCKTCSFSPQGTEYPWPVGYTARGASGEENQSFMLTKPLQKSGEQVSGRTSRVFNTP